MYDEAHPTSDTPATDDASPAREASKPEPPTDAASESPKDDAQVSGPVTPAAPAIVQSTAKKPYVKPRTREQKALDDAIESREKANKAVEAAREALQAANRNVHLRKGREVVFARFERMDGETRQALVAMLPLGSAEDETTTQLYLSALQEVAELAAKKAADQTRKS